MYRLLKSNACLVALIVMSGIILNFGCGGGGGSMSSVNQSVVDTNQQNTVQVPVTQTQQEFIDTAKSEYAKAPESPEANFKMALADSIVNASTHPEIDSLSNDAQGISPSAIGLLRNVVSQSSYSPNYSLVSGINFSAAALKMNAASTVTIGSLQDTLLSSIVPVIDRELNFLRKAEVAEFKYVTTYAYIKRIASNSGVITFGAGDSDELVIDQTDILIIDGVLTMAKGFLNFACVFNFDAQSSQNSYNDVTEVLKIREYSNASGKGVTCLKAARENIALGFDKIVQALQIRALNNNPIPRRKLFWADAAACELVSKELSYIRDALRAGTAVDLKFPEIVSNSAAVVNVNFSAWEKTPAAVDLKTFVKAVMAVDPKSTDATAYDFTLGGLFPAFTSKTAIQAKIDAVRAINSINAISFLQKLIIVDNPAFNNSDMIDIARLVSQIEQAYKTRNVALFTSLFDATDSVAIAQAAAYTASGLPNGAENMEVEDYVLPYDANGIVLGIVARKHNHPTAFKLSKIYNPTSKKLEFRILKVIDNFENNDANFAGIAISPVTSGVEIVDNINFVDGALKAGISQIYAAGYKASFDATKVVLGNGMDGLPLGLEAVVKNSDGTLSKIKTSNFQSTWFGVVPSIQIQEPVSKCSFLVKANFRGEGIVTKKQVNGFTYFKPTKEYAVPNENLTLNFTIPTLPQYEYRYMDVVIASSDFYFEFASDIANINSNLKVIAGRALPNGNITVKMYPRLSNNNNNSFSSYKYLLTGNLNYTGGASATVPMTVVENIAATALNIIASPSGAPTTWDYYTNGPNAANMKMRFIFKNDATNGMTYEFIPNKDYPNVKESGTFSINLTSTWGNIIGTMLVDSGTYPKGFGNQQVGSTGQFGISLDSLLLSEPFLAKSNYTNQNNVTITEGYKKVLP